MGVHTLDMWLGCVCVHVRVWDEAHCGGRVWGSGMNCGGRVWGSGNEAHCGGRVWGSGNEAHCGGTMLTVVVRV